MQEVSKMELVNASNQSNVSNLTHFESDNDHNYDF